MREGVPEKCRPHFQNQFQFWSSSPSVQHAQHTRQPPSRSPAHLIRALSLLSSSLTPTSYKVILLPHRRRMGNPIPKRPLHPPRSVFFRDVEVDDVQTAPIVLFLLLEGVDDVLVGGEMRELVVEGGAVELGEGGELFFGGGLLHDHGVEGRSLGEEPRHQAIGEIRGDQLNGVADERDAPVELSEVVGSGDCLVLVDDGGIDEEEMDEVEALAVFCV
ncbi:hypothetical protein ACLOJK_032035 [Asimina triloba]